MKAFILSLALTASFSLGQSTSLKPEEVHTKGKAIQTSLQTMYVELKNELDRNKPHTSQKQHDVLQAMAASYRSLMALNVEAEGNNAFTATKLAAVEQALEKLEQTSESTILFNTLDNSLDTWISNAQTFSQDISAYATLTASAGNAEATVDVNLSNRKTNTNTLVRTFTVNPQTTLSHHTTTPGLETPQSRVRFVEKITRLNSDFYRQISNTRGFNTGNLTIQPPTYPAAYIFSNGNPGNISSPIRRDTLTPIYNNRTYRTPVRRQPRVTIQIR